MGPGLVTHPHPKGPQPLPGWPGPPSASPYVSLPHSLTLPPPVASVNNLACRGLDKLEEKLPFLQQPSETVPWGPRGGWGWEGAG